jgi:hypothetical protein
MTNGQEKYQADDAGDVILGRMRSLVRRVGGGTGPGAGRRSRRPCVGRNSWPLRGAPAGRRPRNSTALQSVDPVYCAAIARDARFTGKSGVSIWATLINALLGAKFKIVNGFPGATEIILAMERGEVQGIGDWSWSSMKTARPDWLRDGKIILMMQAALQKDPELPDLPSALDFVKNEADRKVMELYLTQKTVARPVIAPPGIPSERLAALRAGFIVLAKDKEFIADAQNTRLEVAPILGEAVDKVISLITSASPETTERLGKAIGSEN